MSINMWQYKIGKYPEMFGYQQKPWIIWFEDMHYNKNNCFPEILFSRKPVLQYLLFRLLQTESMHCMSNN